MAQLVGIADDIDRRNLLAVDRHAHGVIEFAVQIEQGADGPVDRSGLDAHVMAGVLGGNADEEARDLFRADDRIAGDRKSTRLNSSHVSISYAVFCLKKK